MKIAFFNTKSYDKHAFEEENKAFGQNITYFELGLTKETVSVLNGFDAVCVFVNDKLDAEMLSTMKTAGIKLIALRSAGFNNVDLVAADTLGIKVLRVPAYSPNSISEHAVGLILTLARKIHKAYNRVRENNFSLEGLTGFELRGKVVGVIGTGNIGAAFAKTMHNGFGCTVIAYDPFPDKELEKIGVMYTSLQKIFSESDIISLHCPLTPATKHVINADSFALMKPSVMIVNTGRGALIDTKAVISALKKKQIGSLALDVYEYEDKLFFKDLSATVIEDDLILRLLTFPNVLITAHQAFLTETALGEIASTTLANVTAFEKGEKLENEVNVSFMK
jgi:D-lactate dehydrogenase